ncbi:MAG: cytochrome c oxidase assembly protein [Chloroflexota bacterium]
MVWQIVLHDWAFQPTVIVPLVIAAVLYARGIRTSMRIVPADRRVTRRWNAVSFFVALLIIFGALEGPLDILADQLFWPHMIQHLLLIMVAAPLLLLGDPVIPLLRGVPLGLRRSIAGTAMKQSWLHRLGHYLSWILQPVPAVTIFLVDLYLWHWDFLFNLTLRNEVVHDFEHLCFLATALLFWSQVIDQRPLSARLSYAQRTVYTVVASALGNILAMYFVFSPRPVYAVYAHLSHRLFGLGAVADQQYAGAIMWVPVLLLFGGSFAICFYKALSEDSSQGRFPDTGSSDVHLPYESAK